MSFRSLPACLCLAFLLPFLAQARAPQSPKTPYANLTISCDADCSWSVDGEQHGALKKGEQAHVEMLFGAHSIEAKSSDGKLWAETVEVTQAGQPIRVSFSGLVASETGQTSSTTDDKTSQNQVSTGEIPKFYSESRQVIFEAEVWNKHATKNSLTVWSASQIESLTPIERDVLKHLPAPVKGLNAADFHVFDNGVEQRINYFKEADFPGADSTGRWVFHPTKRGTWGILSGPAFDPPMDAYLIGYVPPAVQPGECRSIKVVVQKHEVELNRNQYCAQKNSRSIDTSPLIDTKLAVRMQKFLDSSARGSLNVSVKAFPFWSSGVLTLMTRASSKGSALDDRKDTAPNRDFTYVVEVHDSRAPASVQIATSFDLPEKTWDFPCSIYALSIHVLGVVYKANGEVAGRFDDTFACQTQVSFLVRVETGLIYVPSRFDSQLNLPPGDYEVKVAVTDGINFGRAQIPLRVEKLDAQRLMLSEVVIGGVLRDASWVLREAASVSPSPVVPTPLVSKNVQYFPDTDAPARLRRRYPLYLYFEIYDPADTEKPTIFYRVRITDLKTGVLVMNTEQMRAAKWIMSGNAVVPIGLELDTDKLSKGTYKLEIQASDSTGRVSDWRNALFTIS